MYARCLQLWWITLLVGSENFLFTFRVRVFTRLISRFEIYSYDVLCIKKEKVKYFDVAIITNLS